jgi:hypothetical protein
MFYAGLHDPRGRMAALKLADSLSISELQLLFKELLSLASYGHGLIRSVRGLIFKLPHDWLLAHIEAEAEALLQSGDDNTYRRFLELYLDIDHDLTRRLVQRALAHPDEDIRETGQDFLEMLIQQQK